MSTGAPGGGELPPGHALLEVPCTHAVRWLLRPAAAPPASGRPPLLVCLHGQGQSGARQARWMAEAVPPHFAAAFPDGPWPFEVRRPGRPVRVGHAWYQFDGDRAALAARLAFVDGWLWRGIDAAARELGADGQRVFLAGFSQGAYFGHVSAIRHRERVRGWIGQAGGFRSEYLGGPLPDLGGRAVLLQHGTADETLPPQDAERVAGLLRGAGATVEIALHEAGHVITGAMARQARAWLEGLTRP